MKYAFMVVVLLTLLYNGLLLYVEQHMGEKNYSDVYNNPNIVWSSRGLYDDSSEQNTIQSFKKAFEKGFSGVEVDCYYDVLLDKFIVSHGQHKNSDGTNKYALKDGELLTLKEVFSVLGEGHYFWVDYKNLDRLNEEESLKAIKQLNKITSTDKLKERIYLEGSTPNHLEYYSDAGYKTLFAFGPLREKHPLASISSNFYKMIFYFYDMSAIAIQYGSVENPKYGAKAEKNLKGIPVFLFHVPNETALLKELAKKDEVRVMLVGRDKSINRTDIVKSKEGD
jgi:glycerophosphoryl diester phosphodiesterase